MKYIFLDESGDLGFKEKSCKFFVITLMVCDEITLFRIRRIIRKVKEKILKKKIKLFSELKANNSNDRIRFKILDLVKNERIEVFTIILEKLKVYDYLKSKKNLLYNYTANIIINECSINESKILLIVDKSYGKFLAKEFDNYIKSNLIKNSNNNCIIEIIHQDSRKEPALQVLDFISWCIYRKYESKDIRFYDLIKNKIITEKILFN